MKSENYTNNFKFLGKPDRIFPQLETGKVYALEVVEKYHNFFDWIFFKTYPVIISPIHCPYESWDAFFQNWRLEK